MLIHPKGSPSSRIWVIAESPLANDDKKGYLFSAGLGYAFDKMMQDAACPDYYVICRRPHTDNASAFTIVENELNHYKPPLIIAIGSVGQHFCECLKPDKKHKSYVSQLNKYVGSLLTSNAGLLNYPHYIFPIQEIGYFMQDYTERNVTTYFDLQKLREEYFYWSKHGTIQPLPIRDLRYQEMQIEEILTHFARFSRASLISVDIETMYPKGASSYRPHPGLPVTISISDSPDFAISFNFFRDSPTETRILWRELNELLRQVPNLGQNYFNFDAHFLKALGFEINLRQVQDTLIRHHILWPELPHKLQFQTRQYTREPYYKDDGHHWSFKNMTKLRRYNCLDTAVTLEIYNAQEDEFREKKELK